MDHAGTAENQEQQTGRRAASRPLVRWPARLCVVFSVLLGSAWVWAGAGWLVDLAANLTAQWAALGVLGVLMALARRRWAVAAGFALCLALATLGLALTPRAANTPTGNVGAPVRLLVVNAAASNEQATALGERLRASPADVVVVLETPENLLDFLRDDTELRERLPVAWIPERAGAGYTVVLSRWPQRGGESWRGDESSTFAGGVRAMRMERPAGPFMLLVMHPDSPRTPARWAAGNALVEHAAEVIRTRMAPEGLPIVAAGDLNSSPTGYRSRLFTRLTGLIRAKPLTRPSGTWPASAFWPLRIAIDDVFADKRTGVLSWRPVELPGSDHAGVEVELAFPGP